MLSLLFICSALIAFSEGSNPSRTVSRSGAAGSVNLVEFSIKGRRYGRCTFEDDGEEIELIFEEEDGEIEARSENPTIIDPIYQARRCLEAASRSVEEPGQLRLGLGGESQPETTEQIESRLNDLQMKIQSNQQYISELRPRFIGLGLGALAFSRLNKDYLVTFGNRDEQQTKDIALSLPEHNYNKVGIVFPWKMFQQNW